MSGSGPSWKSAADLPAATTLQAPCKCLRGSYRGSGGGYENLEALVAWLGRQTTQGGRTGALFWAACRAVEQGDDPGALPDTALGLGLEPGEVEATIRSARRQGKV